MSLKAIGTQLQKDCDYLSFYRQKRLTCKCLKGGMRKFYVEMEIIEDTFHFLCGMPSMRLEVRSSVSVTGSGEIITRECVNWISVLEDISTINPIKFCRAFMLDILSLHHGFFYNRQKE